METILLSDLWDSIYCRLKTSNSNTNKEHNHAKR